MNEIDWVWAGFLLWACLCLAYIPIQVARYHAVMTHALSQNRDFNVKPSFYVFYILVGVSIAGTIITWRYR